MSNTIYFAGSEQSAVNGTYGLNTNTAYFDANYVRCSYECTQDRNGVAHKYVDVYLKSETPANSADGFWLHFNKYQVTNSATTSANPVVITNAAGQEVFSLQIKALDAVALRLYSSSNTYVDSANTAALYGNNPENNNRLFHVDIHVYTTAAGHAQADAYRAGHLVATVTNTTGYARGAYKLQFRGTNNKTATGAGPYPTYYSEFIVANFDTRHLRVNTCYPASDGTYTEATGGYANIDEVSRTTDSVLIANIGDRYSFKTARHGNPASKPIIAVAVNCSGYSPDDTAGLQTGLRIGGADYYADSLSDLLGTVSQSYAIFTANPAGGESFPSDMANEVEVIFKAVTVP